MCIGCGHAGLVSHPEQALTLRLEGEGRAASIGPWSDCATPPYAPTDPALHTHPHGAASKNEDGAADQVNTP